MYQTELDSLIVLSWKLIDLGSNKFEEYSKEILIPEHFLFESFFILKTCERILVAFLCLKYSYNTELSNCKTCATENSCIARNILELSNKMIKNSKKYTSVNAFRYLCSVAGSLDSSTIGEPEILGQFKKAMIIQQRSKILFGPLNDIIVNAFKTGKKIHTSSDIPKGRVSILSNAEKIFFDWIENSEKNDNKKISIAIIGTGKMGRDAYKYFKNKFDVKIRIFSRNRTEFITNDLKIFFEPFDFFLRDFEAKEFDVLILCSSTNEPFITTKLVSNQIKILIIDVGIPKNAESSLNNILGISLYQMDQLVQLSEQNYSKRAQSLYQAYEIIEQQVDQVSKMFSKKKINPFIKELRSDLEEVAQRRLTDYTNNKDLPIEFHKWFNNTIKEMMHVSQQHLEKGIKIDTKDLKEDKNNFIKNLQFP